MPGYSRITAQVLAQIVTRHGEEPGVANDRVRFPLRPWDGLARLAADDEEIWFQVPVVDLSVSGIGFETVKPLEVGNELVVELSVAGLEPQHWLCRVVRMAPSDQGVHRCGAVFAGPSSGR